MGLPSTRLRLRVLPGARRSEIVGPYGDAWKLRVAAAPERGRANDAVVKLLAAELEIPESAVSVVSGQTAREKVVELRGLDRPEIERRLRGTLRP